MSPTAVPCCAAHSSAVSAGRAAPVPVSLGSDSGGAGAGSLTGSGAAGGGSVAGASGVGGGELPQAIPRANTTDVSVNGRRASSMTVALPHHDQQARRLGAVWRYGPRSGGSGRMKSSQPASSLRRTRSLPNLGPALVTTPEDPTPCAPIQVWPPSPCRSHRCLALRALPKRDSSASATHPR